MSMNISEKDFKVVAEMSQEGIVTFSLTYLTENGRACFKAAREKSLGGEQSDGSIDITLPNRFKGKLLDAKLLWELEEFVTDKLIRTTNRDLKKISI